VLNGHGSVCSSCGQVWITLLLQVEQCFTHMLIRTPTYYLAS
jgi:hypothetical protein